MKLKVISRSTDEFTCERSQDLESVFHNFDPKLRTQEKAIEYVRALNAATLENIFARPFIGAMDGHIDAVSWMAKNPNHLRGIFSGSMDGGWIFDYSPTGREFVTGSCDRTLRIFQYNGGHSREIYRTKRMQRVFCVKYSCDASYVISGSDDTNLRLWKAKASEQMGVILPWECKKHEYLAKVKDRYKNQPEVRLIVRHRHLPKPIYKAASLRRIMTEADRRKEDRRRAHGAPGSMPKEPFRKRRIVTEVE